LALDTKEKGCCPKCGRVNVRLYKVQGRWMCGKCLRKMGRR